jgi:hypothetical protein
VVKLQGKSTEGCETMQTVLVEPYSTFKEKIRLVKKYLDNGFKVLVFEHYLYIEIEE